MMIERSAIAPWYASHPIYYWRQKCLWLNLNDYDDTFMSGNITQLLTLC